MTATRIVTDSTADIPQELREEHGIVMIPLIVHFGEETFRDAVDLSAADFFQKLKSSDVLPRSSQPSPGDFVELYRPMLEAGHEVVSIHLSARLSGTVQSATLARSTLGDERIHVFDSESASMGIGLMVLEAARMANAGSTAAEIVEELAAIKSRLQVFFGVDTLEYLEKNGRIGRAQALLGSLLSVKPILTLDSGEVAPYERVRGKGKVIPTLVGIVEKRIPPGRTLSCAVVHGDAPQEARELADRLRSRYEMYEMHTSYVGAVIGAHAGPGVVAVCCYDRG